MKETKNIIFLKKNIPNRIKKQVRAWDMFAKLGPLGFVILGFVMHSTQMMDVESILWLGLGLFVVTAVTWWFWTISTIGHISERVHKAESGVQEVLTELRIIRQIFQDIKKDNK